MKKYFLEVRELSFIRFLITDCSVDENKDWNFFKLRLTYADIAQSLAFINVSLLQGDSKDENVKKLRNRTKRLEKILLDEDSDRDDKVWQLLGLH